MSTEIDIRRCIMAILKKWWIVLIAMIVSFLVSVFMTMNDQPKYYAAQSTVYSVKYGSYEDSVEGSAVLQTYSELITSSKVTARAVGILADGKLSAEDIKNMVMVDYTAGSLVLTIKAISEDELAAIKVANAVAKAFVMEVHNITGEENIQVLDQAEKAYLFSGGTGEQAKMRLFITLVGTILMCIIIAMKELFSGKIGSVRDCTLEGELEIIGVIPENEKM